MRHQLRRTAVRAHRQTATDDFAEGRKVGRDAVVLSSTPFGDPEARDHFVEYQQRAVLARQTAQRQQEFLSLQQQPVIGRIGSMITQAIRSPSALNSASSFSSSSSGSTRVSAAKSFGTPAEDG